MSFIAEFQVSNPILEEAVQEVPEIVLDKEDLRSLPSGEWIYVFWARRGDFDALESGLEADPTVEKFTVLAEVDNQKLYRVTLSEEGGGKLTTPIAAKYDIFFMQVDQYTEFTRFRAQVPTREALQNYREETREQGLEFRLNRLYREEGGEGHESGEFGLTPVQRESLRTALREGFFEVPRQTSQAELAAEFDVSNQAFSARLRRGMRTLLANTIDADDPT